MTEAEALRAEAIRLHKAGQVDAAARLYVDVLALRPADAAVAHNLGLIRLAKGDRASALALLEQAHELDPALAWNGYARALIAVGRFADAERLLERRGPETPTPLLLLLRQAWAMRLSAESDLAGAEDQLRQGLALAPDDPDTLGDLGACLFRSGRYGEAAAVLSHALAKAPDRRDLRVNLAGALRLAGDAAEASRQLEAVLTEEPDHLQAFENLSGLLLATDRPESALKLAETRLRIRPGDPHAELARGAALQRLGRLEPSAAAFAAALEGPLAFDALLRLGSLDLERGQPRAAIERLDAALALQPGQPDALLRRATARLSLGHFEPGWRDYAARWDADAFRQFSASIPPDLRRRFASVSHPDQLSGRRLLLLPEQGLGDEIMFASVVEDARPLASSISLICNPRLSRLFTASFSGLGVRDTREGLAPGDYDLILPAADLARLFRNRPSDFPGRPYLRPSEPARVGARSWLGERRASLRVGISWRGGMPGTGRRRRSITLAALAPMLRAPDCEFVSLQYGEAAEEVAAANALLGTSIRTPPAEAIHDIDDLAALAGELDLVVSVQNTLVHICGAIGQTCLALIPHAPEWRYGTEGDAMAWYGSVRLIRQGPAENWEPAVDVLAAELRRRAAASQA